MTAYDHAWPPKELHTYRNQPALAIWRIERIRYRRIRRSGPQRQDVANDTQRSGQSRSSLISLVFDSEYSAAGCFSTSDILSATFHATKGHYGPTRYHRSATS